MVLPRSLSFIDRNNYKVVRDLMRAYAAEHGRAPADALIPSTGSTVVPEQLRARTGSPSSLGRLSAAAKREIAAQITAKVHTDRVEPAVAQAIVDNWMTLEKKYARAADNQEIVAAGVHAVEHHRAAKARLRATLAVQIMTHGSRNMSRSVSYAKPYTRVGSKSLSPGEFNRIAERNFARAAEFVVKNAKTLPVTFETATKLNFMLTRGLIPAGDAGRLYNHDADRFFQWLDSARARAQEERDPLALAEKLHFEISGADAFTDGNGRTARLLADLVLLKHDLPPAYYNNISDYFRRGSVRAPTDRDTKIKYFRRIVDRGQAIMNRADRLLRSLRPGRT